MAHQIYKSLKITSSRKVKKNNFQSKIILFFLGLYVKIKFSPHSINKNFVDSSKTLIEYFSITEDKIYIYFDSWNQLSNKVMMNRFNRH
ncbi:MAG: hypothetical protein CMG36_01860 [Candidatus Marinimicrobia bacterium]|nr:hypothetical protein [Candidatus Neomarinimicrobiota bacterium]